MPWRVPPFSQHWRSASACGPVTVPKGDRRVYGGEISGRRDHDAARRERRSQGVPDNR